MPENTIQQFPLGRCGETAKIIGSKGQEIKGKADAQATGIYASAYNSSPSAADFYQFVKTLDTYQKTLGKDTTAIFTSDSDLFRLFKHIETPKSP